jgi:hypothetical protein
MRIIAKNEESWRLVIQRGKPQNFVEKGVPSAQMEVLKATIAQEELR